MTHAPINGTALDTTEQLRRQLHSAMLVAASAQDARDAAVRAAGLDRVAREQAERAAADRLATIERLTSRLSTLTALQLDVAADLRDLATRSDTGRGARDRLLELAAAVETHLTEPATPPDPALAAIESLLRAPPPVPPSRDWQAGVRARIDAARRRRILVGIVAALTAFAAAALWGLT